MLGSPVPARPLFFVFLILHVQDLCSSVPNYRDTDRFPCPGLLYRWLRLSYCASAVLYQNGPVHIEIVVALNITWRQDIVAVLASVVGGPFASRKPSFATTKAGLFQSVR